MTIGFLGSGKMAGGIRAALSPDQHVLMSSRHDNRNGEIARSCELIFLAVRPQDVTAVAADVASLLTGGQTLVSLVAGKSLETLRSLFGSKVNLVRVMPNLALRVAEGMCALCAEPSAPAEAVARVESILGAAGRVVRLPESVFDAVTALSGSGPAYFAYVAEAMTKGGEALGLAPSDAKLLALQTMLGTARYLLKSGVEFDPFIAGVATPGGTTAAGFAKLANSDVRAVLGETLAAAAQRSRELA